MVQRFSSGSFQFHGSKPDLVLSFFILGALAYQHRSWDLWPVSRLAALRSLIPDEWELWLKHWAEGNCCEAIDRTAQDMDHEVAWNWLWENVERVVRR